MGHVSQHGRMIRGWGMGQIKAWSKKNPHDKKGWQKRGWQKGRTWQNGGMADVGMWQNGGWFDLLSSTHYSHAAMGPQSPTIPN